MPEYRIGACKVEDFGVYEFFAMKGPKTPVEGKFTFISYDFTGLRENEPSGLAVVRNFENAIRKVGGTILQSDPQRWVNGKIVKLLTADPGLKIHVVGHTDNVGGVDSNIKLSQDRAEAVLQALVRNHGIAPGRLRAFGCGQFAPVASSDTEEGRAKNRRVELVKQ